MSQVFGQFWLVCISSDLFPLTIHEVLLIERIHEWEINGAAGCDLPGRGQFMKCVDHNSN